MKKLIAPVIALLLITACQEKGPTRYTNSSPEIDVAKALIKDYQDGNWEAWITHYADTAKVHHNTVEPSSPMEVQEGLKENLKALSSYKFLDKDMFHEMVIDDKGEKWVNFWATWEGTIAESGEKLIIPVHLTIQFVDGKIVEEHGFYDLSRFMTAMNELEASKMAEAEKMEE